MPVAYYNEFDEYVAGWLRNLIAAGHIAPGDVDTRSIEDVRPDDLRGYTQCHFFAGVGVWSLALRRAGWPDDRPVWTGSCPCQPFSAAGEGLGFADERHLWPSWHHLLRERRPPVVFGEQVASKDADVWIDLVQDDMEGLDYAFGATPFPSAGVGAPHIRDRLYWVAHAAGTRLQGRQLRGQRADAQRASVERDGEAGGLGHANGLGAGWDGGSVRSALDRQGWQHGPDDARASGAACRLADNHQHGRTAAPGAGLRSDAEREAGPRGGDGGVGDPASIGQGGWAGLVPAGYGGAEQQPEDASAHGGRPDPTNGFWRDPDWLLCRDGRWRPVEPGSFPLAHGAPARVGRLRAYGNAINAQAAEAFVRSYLEVTGAA